MKDIRTLWVLAFFGSLLYLSVPKALGQQSVVSSTAPASNVSTENQELISLQFPPNLELKTLIQYVGNRLSINFIYDEQAVAQRITIVSPAKISKESLMGLLESALKMKGLVVVDGDQPGWKRILPASGLASAANPTTQPSQATLRPAAAVTQVFVLRYADPQRADTVIRPFLTQPGGNSVTIADQRLLIISDFASAIGHVASLIRLLDQPPREVATRFVLVQNLDVAVLVPELQQILSAKDRTQASPNGATSQNVEVLQDVRTNQVILVGPPEVLAAVESITASLDVPLPLETRVYSLRSLSPDRLDHLVRELIDPLDAKRLYQSASDKDAGLLVVTTTQAIHQKIETLKSQLDVQATRVTSPIRFYKLTNSTATDVLATIRSLEEAQSGQGNGEVSTPPLATPNLVPETGNATPSAQEPSISNPQYHDNLPSSGFGAISPYSNNAGLNPVETAGSSSIGTSSTAGPTSTPPASPGSSSQPIVGVHTIKATITADPNTNTIIVEADPATQKIYENLIKTLDKRRPQVLIQCTLITLDTTDNFSLGVELGADTQGKPNVITFNSFGLSTPNPTTGALTLIPAAGFNGTLLGSAAAQVVIQALQTSGRARVLSSPQILVNDNATGTLQSVQEEPYTSENSSTVVSTTSFAGYAEAGTTITLTPHISEGDHLQLEYSISLNNFTGSASNGIPPPRQTDAVQSKITIPDDTTVIVGGLNSNNDSKTRQTIPILGDIPLIRELFSQRTHDRARSTLFVFIRPVILRDDQFADLKLFSERDAAEAGLSRDYPESAPPPDPLKGLTVVSIASEEYHVKSDRGANEQADGQTDIRAFAQELGIPFSSSLSSFLTSAQFVSRVPIAFAREHGVMGLTGPEGNLILAIAKPQSWPQLDVIGRFLGTIATPLFTSAETVSAAINDAYQRRTGQAQEMIQNFDGSDVKEEIRKLSGRDDLLDVSGRAPVIKLVNLILFEAVKSGASDVHIQPSEGLLMVRLRLDGVLFDAYELPNSLHEEVVGRLKVMGRMNIAEKRLPQDGRATVRVGDRIIDLRLASLPTCYGERIVVRLLDKSARLYQLSELGMDARTLTGFRKLIGLEHGLILVTGPTGSGKSTTLYAALKEIDYRQNNVLTLEDPIEYQLEGISQSQVSDKKGMTFASGLRSVLRQDPDIIMVGEIRDRDTAGMAIQSALTGHLVFSTLHTNDAASAVTRLLDLGTEPYLLASSLVGVLAQRLLRKVCGECWRIFQ